MKINGLLKTVMPNLWDALKRMRGVESERILWIDALCINQDDISERSSQVGFMGRIYSNAVVVLIWLGEVLRSGEDRKYFESDAAMHNALYALSIFLPNPEHRIVSLIFSRVAGHIERKSYWNRVWIIQDIILASKLIIQYGEFELDAKVVFRTMDESYYYGGQQTSRAKEILEYHYTDNSE